MRHVREVIYREHAPCPALAGRVLCHWTLRSHARVAASHRVLPDGCIDLLFSGGARVGDGGRREGSIVGVMSRAVIADSDGEIDLIGVRFAPGEAAAMLGVRGDETRDAVLELELVLGRAGRELARCVAEATTTPGRIALLDRFLLDRLARVRAADPRVRAAVRILQRAAGSARIDALAVELGISERQLERAFDERVGLSPKRFARVMRMQALRARLAAATAPSWARLAGELGFADQAHLVRETRALVGTTPRQWMSESFNARGGDERMLAASDEAARCSADEEAP